MPTVKQYQKGGTHTQTFEKGGQKQDKERVAYSFLTAQGWTPEQTIGIIGNIKRESGFNPNAVGDAGKAFGLAQWHPDRQAKAKSLYGDNWKSFENQLKFIDWELRNTEKAAGDRLKNTKNAWQAGQVVSDFYERPQIKFVGDETRQTHVADAAMKFKGIKLTPEDNINYAVSYENSVAPYMNAPQVQATPLPTMQVPEMQTQQVSYLETPQETTNLAEEAKPSKINPQEEAFMQDLLSQMAQGVAYIEPEKSAVFQDGGINQFKKKPFRLKEERNLVQKDNTSTPKPQTQKKLTKEQAIKVQEDLYRNPQKIEGISSGDEKLDLLYNNEWLLSTPIIGDFIKDKAKNIALRSSGMTTIPDVDETLKREVDYKGSQNTQGVGLVDQYFSDKPLFPKSKYKPRSDYFEFLPTYSVKEDFNKNPNKEKFNAAIENVLSDPENFDADINKVYDDFLETKKPIYRKTGIGSAVQSLVNTDLSGHKFGMAWDEQKNLPYISLSDAWDFEPKSYSEKWRQNTNNVNNEEYNKSFIQSYLLHKAGHPFKVYDRFYFDPKTKEYISDEEIQKLNKKQQDKKSVVFQEGGKIPISSNGMYDYPNQKVIIPSSRITMKNINHPILAITDQGDRQILQPEKEYQLKGSNTLEIPLTQAEENFLKDIYNTK